MQEQTDYNELKRRILENLAAPEEVQTDSGRVKNQSITQQIKALDYLKRKQAEEENGGGQAKRCGLYKLNNLD